MYSKFVFIALIAVINISSVGAQSHSFSILYHQGFDITSIDDPLAIVLTNIYTAKPKVSLGYNYKSSLVSAHFFGGWEKNTSKLGLKETFFALEDIKQTPINNSYEFNSFFTEFLVGVFKEFNEKHIFECNVGIGFRKTTASPTKSFTSQQRVTTDQFLVATEMSEEIFLFFPNLFYLIFKAQYEYQLNNRFNIISGFGYNNGLNNQLFVTGNFDLSYEGNVFFRSNYQAIMKDQLFISLGLRYKLRPD